MHEIKLPQLGQSVEEAAIVQWFKAEGQPVEKGEPLFSVQTDKAEIECEATASGVLRKILAQPDDLLPVLAVVALVGESDEPLPDLKAYAKPVAAAAPASAAPSDAPRPSSPAPQRAVANAAPAQTGPANTGDISPRARALAERRHLATEFIPGTGPGGRVIEADVLRYAADVDALRVSPSARRHAQRQGVDLRGVAGSGTGGRVMRDDVLAHAPAPAAPTLPIEGRLVPLTPMRRIVAERMAASKFSAPHYYVTVEVDMAEAMAFRKSFAEFKPSVNDLVMRGVVLAIQEIPEVNTRWHGTGIEYLDKVHLGMAVALESGLVVPVIRNAHERDLKSLHDEAARLAEGARTNRLLPDAFQGSTFTISNLGPFGVDQFTAIINTPNSAILAAGQIKERPAVVDGAIVARPLMNLTLSSDHRVIDGAVAAKFMGALKTVLESAAFGE